MNDKSKPINQCVDKKNIIMMTQTVTKFQPRKF